MRNRFLHPRRPRRVTPLPQLRWKRPTQRGDDSGKKATENSSLETTRLEKSVHRVDSKVGRRFEIRDSHFSLPFEGRAIRQNQQDMSNPRKRQRSRKRELFTPPETNAAARNLGWERRRIMHGMATACAVMARDHTRTRLLHLLISGQRVVLRRGRLL